MYKIKKEKLIRFYNSADLLQVINLALFGSDRKCRQRSPEKGQRPSGRQGGGGPFVSAVAVESHSSKVTSPGAHFLQPVVCDSVAF